MVCTTFLYRLILTQECSREITKVSSELLFEVWDQAGESELFLGLTIGSIVYEQY